MSRAAALAAERIAPASAETAASTAERSEPGNQALQSLSAGGLRAKLEVGGADDPEEREADRLAERALSGPTAAPCACGAPGCSSCGGAKVRRKAESGAAPVAVAAGFGNRAGHPLDLGTRRHFEPRFGADFSAVRVHDDPATHRFARGIGARAFAVRHDIGFAEGRNDPGTAAGERLLAHELAHVALGHGGARRQLDDRGPARIAPLPTDALTVRSTAHPLPIDEPKTPGLLGPSTPFFLYDGVVVADDRQFMRDELRRLIADRGLLGALQWAGWLFWDGGRDSEPLIATAISFFTEVPQVPSREEKRRREEQEKARAALAAKAIPTAIAVLTEIFSEAEDFLKAFEATGIAATQAILTESEARANAERIRFGLKRTETTHTRTAYLEHGMSYTEQYSSVAHGMNDQLAGKGLAGAAKDLLAKRSEATGLRQQQRALFQGGPNGDLTNIKSEYKRLGEEATKKEAELMLLEGIYRERYPILEGISGDYDALTQVASGPSAKTAEVLGKLIFGTLDNIKEVRAELHPDGKVQVWRLPDIVSLAKSSSGCNDPTPLGAMKTRLVNDKVKAVEDQEFWRNMALTALTLGLALLAAIPSGGSSLAVGAAAVAETGAFAISAVQAAQQIDQFELDNAMAGTDFDRARAIGTSDPSLFWLAVDILGAFADLGPALKGSRQMLNLGRAAFQKALGPARRLLTDKDAVEALADLRQAADELGLPSLPGRVLASTDKLRASPESMEKILASAAAHEADAVKAGVKELEEASAKALGKWPTTLGGHIISVTRQGWLVRCTHCGVLHEQYAKLFAVRPDLEAKLLDLEQQALAAKRSKASAAAVAKEAAEFADSLDQLEQIGPRHNNGGRGLNFVWENLGEPRSKKKKIARTFDSETSHAASSVTGKQRAVPALDYMNKDEGGRSEVRFDGWDWLPNGDILLIDAKTRLFSFKKEGEQFFPSSVPRQLTRQSEAIAQNPGYKGMIELLPGKDAAKHLKEAEAMLEELGIKNIGVRIKGN